MKINKPYLKSLMALHSHSYDDLTRHLNISYSKLQNKLFGRTNFVPHEVKALAELYQLDEVELKKLFTPSEK